MVVKRKGNSILPKVVVPVEVLEFQSHLSRIWLKKWVSKTRLPKLTSTNSSSSCCLKRMFLINYMETMAFAMLAYDAFKGRTKHISLQTCIALTLSLILGAFNLPRAWGRKVHKLILVVVSCCFGSLACYGVSKDSETDGEDTLNLPGLPAGRAAGHGVIYVSALMMGLLSLFVACHFSFNETYDFMFTDVQSSVCTFQNFLHAFALLPQLVLCRRKGFVSPAALRFLVLLGTKHLYEFITDAYVSYLHYQRGKLQWHEFSFMSGDLVAALILLDFLYLVLADEGTLLLLLGCKEMELHDEEAGTDMEAEPTKWQWALHQLQPFLESSKKRHQVVMLCASSVTVVVMGVQLGLLNVYACLSAALLYGGFRGFQFYQDSKIPLKGQKCCLWRCAPELWLTDSARRSSESLMSAWHHESIACRKKNKPSNFNMHEGPVFLSITIPLEKRMVSPWLTTDFGAMSCWWNCI